VLNLTNIGLLATYNSKISAIERTHDCTISIDDGIITDISGTNFSTKESIDCNGKLVTPGFVDAHTHPVFVDGRENEFMSRLAGVSYQEIAKEGGGINSSIAAVRNATEIELYDRVIKRMDKFIKMGTTTLEAKSGYGLDTESELKSLRVLDHLNSVHEIDIVSTFLGAHAIPPEFNGDSNGYITLLCKEMIPAVAEQGIAKFCDVFCEEGYFNVNDSQKILQTATQHSLIPRLHADEFTDSGAASLAAEIGAISADHLMEVNDQGIKDMAKAGVTAILLPGTTFFLGDHSYAPARKIISEGINVALATDFNPGSCHIQSMPFIISLACLFLDLTLDEALKAATWTGACALNVEENVGSIEVGKKADLIIWDLDTPEEIPYNVASVPIQNVIKNGKLVIRLD
jgi:imidazolonepropionase